MSGRAGRTELAGSVWVGRQGEADVDDRLEALLAAGDRDAAVMTMMREMAGLPPQVVERLRANRRGRRGSPRVAAAHTIPRELRAVKAYQFAPARFRDLRVLTLLLVGRASPAAFRTTVQVVDAALPDSRLVVLPGRGYATMDTAGLFATQVHRFVKDCRDGRVRRDDLLGVQIWTRAERHDGGSSRRAGRTYPSEHRSGRKAAPVPPAGRAHPFADSWISTGSK